MTFLENEKQFPSISRYRIQNDNCNLTLFGLQLLLAHQSSSQVSYVRINPSNYLKGVSHEN
jgi:hypothetical protein